MKKKKQDENGNTYYEFKEGTFYNKTSFILTSSDGTEAKIDRSSEEIFNKLATWMSEGSGLVVDRIINHYVNTVKYEPLRVSSYIDLPKELKNSMKGLINLKNTDNKCAVWCIVRHLNPRKKDPQRITLEDRKFLKKYDISKVDFPTTLKDIRKLEDIFEININCFDYEKGVYPL